MLSGWLLGRRRVFYGGTPMSQVPLSRNDPNTIIVIGDPKRHHLAVSRWRPQEGNWFFMNFVKDGFSYDNYFAQEDAAIQDTIQFYYKIK